MRIWQQGIRSVLASALLVGLAGCFEVAPQQVAERIVIQNDGQIRVEYSGTFTDLIELTIALSKKRGERESAPELDQLEASAQASLAAVPTLKELRQPERHLFFARFEEDGDLNQGHKNLPFWLGNYALPHKSPTPVLVEMEPIADLSGGFMLKDNLSKDHGDLREIVAAGPELGVQPLQDLIKGFGGTLSVEIDDALVLEQNATERIPVSAGRSVYQWNLKLPMQPIKFRFSMHPQDKLFEKAKQAPAGTSCQALFGENCKCGPFVMRQPSGKPVGRMGYQIMTGEGTTRGCLDAEGQAAAVIVKTTGVCEIRLLPAATNELCP